MNAGTKVGGFLAGLVVVGVVGAGIGTLAGPIDTGTDDHASSGAEHARGADEHAEGVDEHAEGEAGHGEHEEAGGAGEAASGTSATQDGYRLALDPTDGEIRFTILDPDGAPVVDTEVLHERPLHLIVVGRDLVGYAHLHPEVDADGTWSVERPDLAPGSYRVVADLQPVGGPELTLAGDLTVPGPVATVAPPAPEESASVDGLTVSLDGHVEVGEVELSFSGIRTTADEPAPVPVEPEPYLGARGHLVAFRTADLAYAHVHPHSGDEGPVRFTASFPTPGTYRLFLDLQVDGVVRTFPFTVEVHGHGH